MIGDRVLRFPDTESEPLTTAALPLPGFSGYPHYQGGLAAKSQNIHCDEQGDPLFFIKDGEIFNSDGMLIADAAAGPFDNDCHVCFLAGEETHIVPVPGTCAKFYVMSLWKHPNTNNTHMRVGVLDMRLPSDLPVYEDLCATVWGRFVNHWEQQGPPFGEQSFDFSPTSSLPAEPVYGTGGSDPELTYLWDVDILSYGGQKAYHASTLKLHDDPLGRSVMVLRANMSLIVLLIEEDRIRHLTNNITPGFHHLPLWFTSDTTTVYDVLDHDDSYRGQLTLRENAPPAGAQHGLQVAHSSYVDWFDSIAVSMVHQLMVTYWRIGVDLVSSPPRVVFYPGGVNSTDPNPRWYALDTYPFFEQPVDYQYQVIARPAVCGLAFTPDGSKLYFVKSSNFEYWYPPVGWVATTFGYIDVNVPCPPPPTSCPYFTYIPFDTPEETRKLADTQMFLHPGPDDGTPALYMLAAEMNQQMGTDYWLSVFKDPDLAAFTNFDMRLLPFENVDRRTEEAPPEYRLLNPRMVASDQFITMGQAACCTDMVNTRDRSTVITPDCDGTWAYGSNPFFNTQQPLYIATELRIASGAHVTAHGMDFRFSPDAVLIIEPGASLVCHGCIFQNNSCGERWKGIDLHGNFAQHQGGFPYPTHQGYLLLNNSTVRNAEIGVLVAHRDANGIIKKNKEGGVLRTLNGTRFENNRQGVIFRPYRNFHPTTLQPQRNLSRFNNTTFTVDESYPDKEENYDFMHHVNMSNVDGIQFTACNLLNQLPDTFFVDTGLYPGSLYLGHGIYSLDADYRVQAQCTANPPPGPGQPCPPGQHIPTLFQGLDHGIHARTGTSLRNFTVDRAQFTDNIAGVYTEGVIGYKVVHSLFEIGDREVALTNPIEELWLLHHRGIYTYTGHAFIPDFNHFRRSGRSPAEGVVIGYSRDHNDMVFGNTAEELDRGFVGEGICADPEDRVFIGLQLMCNTNDSNVVNLWSRQVVVDPNTQDQTIRINQGQGSRVADNGFDRELGLDDFRNTNLPDNILRYYWDSPADPFEPIHPEDPNVPGAVLGVTKLMGYRPLNNCARRLAEYPYEPNDPPGMVLLGEHLTAQKLAYGNTRYLYEQLRDGGSSDEVVQEITSSWPQDAWDLRAYLLARSPHLSVGSLRSMVLQGIMPDAMVAEILIANPDATRTEGFITWLQDVSGHPLPEYLLGAVVASWNMITYRTTLENTMAHHHGEMTQSAHRLLEFWHSDSTDVHLAEVRMVWQQLRTPAARYAEALLLLEQHQYQDALAIVQGIPQEHPRLRPKELSERDRMLALIAFLQTIHATGRDASEMDSGEVAQLEALVNGKHDRPAVWAQNILCFHYGMCRAPLTGGDDVAPKALPYTPLADLEVVRPSLHLHPNPASTWVAFTYDLLSEPKNAAIVVRDGIGREVARHTLRTREGQVLQDTRELAPGAYTVELLDNKARKRVEKLIVRP